jgi:hypothetical protein
VRNSAIAGQFGCTNQSVTRMWLLSQFKYFTSF